MKKKKKDAVAIQTRKAENKELDGRFLERITIIGKALVGEEKFSLIPLTVLEQITKSRAPRLKAKAAYGSDILSSTVKQYNKLFYEFIKEHSIETPYNSEISVDYYLSEGIVLLNCISVLPDKAFHNASLVKEAFQQYLPGSDHHTWMVEFLETIIMDAIAFLSELDKHIIHADMTDTAWINPYTVSNTIFLKRFSLEKTKIVIDNANRTIIRLGWILATEEWAYNSISPAKLGYEGESADVPLPIYIQQHAIDKLQKRIDITPGIMHFGVVHSFDESILYLKTATHVLVPYFLSEQKVGYLLCKWFDNKILIHTFLFLTNDGTPEGKMLKKLCLLEKADKEYLRIDTMPHFNSYHFDKDERLSALFTAAGCGSLLKIGHLEEYSKKSIADKDPESILKYL